MWSKITAEKGLAATGPSLGGTMKTLIAAFAIAAILAAWNVTEAAAQGPYMKAAPSADPAPAPAKSDMKKKPNATKLCTPPGGGPAKPC
jgi:hypothetical protein